jgi:hypothetical protein
MLLVSSQAVAAEPFKMPVEVVATANDSVGKRLVYFVKEGIQSSSTLELAISPELGLRLQIVTLDQNSSSPGYSTAYSFVVTWVNKQQPFPYYLNQYVGYCGSSRVQECAQDLVASTAENSESVLRLLKAAYESNTKK